MAMKDNGVLLVIAFAVVLGAVLLLGGPRGEHPLVGKAAPELSLAILDGGTLDLAAHRDKEVVLLDFWATWCGPCRASMPAVESVAEEFGERGVVLYAVNENESPAEIRSFLEQLNLNVQVALDPGFQAGRAYAVTGIPQLVVIGKDGVVQSVHVGAAPGLAKTLRGELDTLVSGGSLVDSGS